MKHDEAYEERVGMNGEIERIIHEAVKGKVAAVAVVVLLDTGELTYGFKVASHRTPADTIKFLACGGELMTIDLVKRAGPEMFTGPAVTH